MPAGSLALRSSSASPVIPSRRFGTLVARGADYATFGPVFETPSKRDFGPPLGLEELRKAADFGLPLFGLGGVTSVTASRVRQTGAFGVAVIGAWLGAENAREAVQRLLSAPHRVTQLCAG